MSFPEYPRQDPYGQPYPGQSDAWSSAQPGPIPLRPLGVGEILGVAVTVVRRCLPPLLFAALVVGLLSSAVTVGLLAAAGTLQSYAEATWLEDVLRGGTSIPMSIAVSALAGLLVSMVGAQVVAGVATVYAGALAQGRDGRGEVTLRLRGRWAALIGVSTVVGALVSVGLMLLVVPGVFAFLLLALAAPAVAMERSGIGESLRRSAALSRGQRGRIFGVVALAVLIGTLGGAVVTAVLGSLFGQHDPVTTLLITQGIGAVVGAFTGAWTGAVIALLYIDIRIRTERLDYALRLAADLDRKRGPGRDGPPAGGLTPPPAG